MNIATFGAGCFWCVEAIFKEVKGVQQVLPGYMGGGKVSPTYKEVCTGTTGHAEVAQIKFDPNEVNYEKLLEIFWIVHDPTTLNRQGNDVGTQYRSVVFYHNQDQKELAEKIRQRLDQSGAWSDPIITEITEASEFYPAEDYHHDYYAQNSDQLYCANVVRPKLEKFRKVFADFIK